VTTKHVEGGAWICEISLRVEYSNTETEEEKLPRPKTTPLKTLQQAFRATMSEAIAEAQQTLLAEGADMCMKNFTRNVVCVKLSGDEFSDLSIVDLPGLIQSASTAEDQKDVDRVRSLVESYMAEVQAICA